VALSGPFPNPVPVFQVVGANGTANAEADFSDISFPAIGSHAITAVYNGDINYKSVTSQPATIQVNNPAPNVNISLLGQTVQAGQSVTVTASVVSPIPGGPALT